MSKITDEMALSFYNLSIMIKETGREEMNADDMVDLSSHLISCWDILASHVSTTGQIEHVKEIEEKLKKFSLNTSLQAELMSALFPDHQEAD